MDVSEWRRRLRPIRDAVYDDLVEFADCGPFDGGCVVLAEALQSVAGGEVVVLTDMHEGTALHAAVLLDGNLWDYDGPMNPERFIKRFSHNELQHTNWVCSTYRPIRDGDLEDACRDGELRDRLAARFREVLPEFTLRDNSSP